MPVVSCPVPECEYSTPDMSDAIVAALLTAHCVTHSVPNAPPTAPTHKVESVKRPTIAPAGTSEEWSYFLIRWNDYVNATGITGKQAVIQLLECCEESLRKDLTRSVGGSLLDQNINDVLASIKSLAVREENVMVARVNLHNMTQDRDEPVRSFGARIRGQAGVCKFITTCQSCQAEVNYTEAILRDVLTRGIEDQEIQLDLLGNPNQNMTLEQVFQYVETKESGKRSASLLIESHNANSSSSYKRNNQVSLRNKSNNETVSPEPCSYCGKVGHGKRAPARVRKNECPAYGKDCKACDKPNHFESVCRSKKLPQSTHTVIDDEIPESNSVFNELCAITAGNSNAFIALDHHQYDKLSQSWVKKSSDPQPFINLTVSTSDEDYYKFGFKLSANPRSSNFDVMADTGCQSCLAGIRVIHRLNMKTSDLIPVTMKMRAANNKGINILGAAILRYTGRNENGEKMETRQITYITDNSDKIFLSKEACISLGMIPKSFPRIGEVQHTSASSNEISSPVCNCPKRQLPPPPPTKLPFPATDENRLRLQQYLINYYQSSTFNTCEHQPLRMMEGPPMKLMVDPAAEPKAIHTPVPVPLHWQEEVKRGLDQDVNLGVIEPVPVGEPVTWCHRSVVCAKKSGKPRRTVDLQELNKYATRETHHTQSPFHQARSVPHGKKKTVLDAWNGYHSVPIRKEDRHLTTFINPWGRYRYRTAPQGYIASGDGYSRRYDESLPISPIKPNVLMIPSFGPIQQKRTFFKPFNGLISAGVMVLL